MDKLVPEKQLQETPNPIFLTSLKSLFFLKRKNEIGSPSKICSTMRQKSVR
jgi:hypothetical protein